MTIPFKRLKAVTPTSDVACRSALKQLVGSVAIATVGAGEQRWATAATVTTLPGEAPTLLVAVRCGSSFHEAVLEQRAFGVSLLSVRHAALAGRLGRLQEADALIPSEDRRWTLLESGVCILADAMTAFDCALEDIIARDGHALLIGRIRSARSSPQGDPLLSWRGSYRSLVGTGEEWAPLIESYGA